MIEAWIIACLGLMVLPGPDMALITRYALRGQGWRALGGLYLAFAIYSFLILLGLLAILQSWPEWSQWARIVGGIYLLWLSLSGIWNIDSPDRERKIRGNSPFWAGFWSNALNAKQYLFLFLLMPGFLPKEADWQDTLLLLLILLAVSLLFWTVWIWGIQQAAERWQKGARLVEIVSLIALGAVGVLLLLGVV